MIKEEKKLIYASKICLACGVDLNSINWLPSHCYKCRTCFNNKIPKNKDICNKIILTSKIIEYYCVKCECLLELNNNWQEKNKNKGWCICNKCKSSKEKIRNLNMKEQIQNGYNRVCSCCGENGWQFLTIDHIFNDGINERNANLKCGTFFKYLIESNFPKDRYQLLCMNCNYSKGRNQFCPHEIKNKRNNCYFCNCDLNKNNMFECDFNNNYSLCKYCSVKINKKNNLDIIDKNYSQKDERLKLKQDIINNYGGKCECCDENEFYFMTIDHILGGGSSRLNKTKLSAGNGLYRYLRQNNYPKDEYRILCYNCNCSRGDWGKCYHELNREHNKIITIEDYKQLVMNNLV